jgi:hypothetical protein
VYCTYDQVHDRINFTTTQVSQTITESFITRADALIDSRVGKSWATATTKTEYFDLVENEYNANPWLERGIIIPTKPYKESKDRVFLSITPITEVIDVWLLSLDETISKIFSYDSSGTSYTDNTKEANSIRGTPFYAFASTVGENDILYIGHDEPFVGVGFRLSTAGVGGTLTWEYYDGSSWTTLTVTESISNIDDLNTSRGEITYDYPAGWTEVAVNSSAEMFWIRAKVSSAHSTSPKISHIYLKPNSVISKEISPAMYQFDSNTGRLVLLEDNADSGTDRLCVTYKYGASSTPVNVTALSINLAAQACLAYRMGGSFDDVTSGSVEGLAISLGEPYTNLRATIHELKKEELMLWQELGRRVNIFVT